MVNGISFVWKLDRRLLAVYLITLLSLLIFPLGVPEFHFLGVATDKWIHFALFGGLAVLVRWNISASHHPILVSVGVVFIVALAMEVVQSLILYRSAELWDLLAGFLGALLGAIVMNRLVSIPVSERSIGLVVSVLGLFACTLFVLADVIGVGRYSHFGTVQMVGAALGALVTVGGVRVYIKGLRGK